MLPEGKKGLKYDVSDDVIVQEDDPPVTTQRHTTVDPRLGNSGLTIDCTGRDQ